LVIDDEPRVVTALARLLQRDGSVVATARNGRHALAVLQLPVFCATKGCFQRGRGTR